MRSKELLAKLEMEGLQISESTLSKIECGNRGVSDFEVVAFADALNVTVGWLLEHQ